MWRRTSRDVAYLVCTAVVAENIDWVRRVNAIVAESVQIVATSSIERIQNVREKTVAVHSVVVALTKIYIKTIDDN